MRMRVVVGAALLAVVLAGCTAAPRAHDGPLIIPREIAWRYAMSCVESAGDVGIMAMAWSNAGATIELESDDPDADLAALENQVVTCLTAHRYQEHVDSFISAYERERLYGYYRSVTLPCLERQGIDVAPIAWDMFSQPAGGEPWNPYLGMELPFDRLLELYQTCPPRPATLSIADG